MAGSKKGRQASKNRLKHKHERQFERTIKRSNGIWRGQKIENYIPYKKKKKKK